jgi:uncharacterized protein
MVERALVRPPHSHIGALSPDQRREVMQNSVVAGVYETAVDRESAYERLNQRAANAPVSNSAAPPATAGGGYQPVPPVQGAAGPAQGTPGSMPANTGSGGGWLSDVAGVFTQRGPRGGESILQAAAKSATRAMATQAGREIMRGVLGSILGGLGASSSRSRYR